ncbi:MAG: GntR family transcriptional regulator [Ktedonobacterales bacterium]
MSDEPLLTLDLASATPPFEQIAAQIRAQVMAGRLRAGDELPSVRQMARDLRVAPNTVARAYETLAHDGWAHAEPRRGVRVAGGLLAPHAAAHQRSLSQEVARLLLHATRLGLSGGEVRAEVERQLGVIDP